MIKLPLTGQNETRDEQYLQEYCSSHNIDCQYCSVKLNDTEVSAHFLSPEQLLPIADHFAPIGVPLKIPMAAARIVLMKNGIYEDEVLEIIQNIENSESREIALIEWEYRSHVLRNSPLVSFIASIKELSDEDIDNMFIDAKQFS